MAQHKRRSRRTIHQAKVMSMNYMIILFTVDLYLEQIALLKIWCVKYTFVCVVVELCTFLCNSIVCANIQHSTSNRAAGSVSILTRNHVIDI